MRRFDFAGLTHGTWRSKGLALALALAGVAGCQLLVDGNAGELGGGPRTDEGDVDATTPDGGESAGQNCGRQICEEGTVCCNASCGICTLPGRVCLQIACDDGGDGDSDGSDGDADDGSDGDGSDGDGDNDSDGDGDDDDDPPSVSCLNTLCKAGTHCVDTAQGPSCVPDKEPNPCELVDCVPDRVCVVIAGEAKCVRKPSTSCASTSCPADTYCDDISGEAKCLPLPSCKGVMCEKGRHCELEAVTCVRAPCPPQPTCVPDNPCLTAQCAGKCEVVDGEAHCLTDSCSDPCATERCASGTHCESQQVQCVTTPCCRQAECVSNSGPSGKFCGGNVCEAGEYCCNESCGICAPTGGACTLQVCQDR